MPSSSYRIVITGTTLPAPADGFIDGTRIEHYLPRTGEFPAGLTYDLCKAKRRANLRFMQVVANLDLIANVYVTAVEAPDASATTAPSSLTLDVAVERGDGVLLTPDELNPGQTLTGAAALKRAVARALIWAHEGRNIDVLDPTPSPARGNTNEARRVGHRIEPLAVGALANDLTAAEALVTVTPNG